MYLTRDVVGSLPEHLGSCAAHGVGKCLPVSDILVIEGSDRFLALGEPLRRDATLIDRSRERHGFKGLAALE
jgi:hypothetical protein